MVEDSASPGVMGAMISFSMEADRATARSARPAARATPISTATTRSNATAKGVSIQTRASPRWSELGCVGHRTRSCERALDVVATAEEKVARYRSKVGGMPCGESRLLAGWCGPSVVAEMPHGKAADRNVAVAGRVENVSWPMGPSPVRARVTDGDGFCQRWPLPQWRGRCWWGWRSIHGWRP